MRNSSSSRCVLCCCALVAACAAEREGGDLPSAIAAGSGAPSARATTARQDPVQPPVADAKDSCPAGPALPAGVGLPGAASKCGAGSPSRVFEHGLCSCNDAIFTGNFSIDALDSGASGRPASASVGVNGELTTTGIAEIGGSLIVAGRGMSPITSASYRVDGNFETNSNLVVTGANIEFGRDLWVNGAISVLGFSSVAGDVYQTPGNPMTGMSVGGQLFQRSFQIAKPCACGEGDVLDVEAIVEAGVSGLGGKPGALFQLGTGGTRELGCGPFAFGPTTIIGINTLKVTGHTALYVDGDLTITGSFGVDVGAFGELDVFVSGNLLITGVGGIGSPARPAAVRFYVGGTGDIALTGSQVFAANLYAPRSRVMVTGVQDLWGSLFVGSYLATGSQRMHYDAAVVRSGGAGKACDTPPDRCKVDLDCKSPKVCAAGSCEQLGPE